MMAKWSCSKVISGTLCWIFSVAGLLLKSLERRHALSYFSDTSGSGTMSFSGLHLYIYKNKDFIFVILKKKEL